MFFFFVKVTFLKKLVAQIFYIALVFLLFFYWFWLNGFKLIFTLNLVKLAEFEVFLELLVFFLELDWVGRFLFSCWHFFDFWLFQEKGVSREIFGYISYFLWFWNYLLRAPLWSIAYVRLLCCYLHIDLCSPLFHLIQES